MKKIRLNKIRLENFQNWKELEYEFDEKLEIIVAPYGSGKTTIYNGFLYALGIDLPSGVEVITKNDKLELPNDLIATCVLDLIIDDELYTFERNSNNKFKINGDKITTLKKYNESIEKIIGVEKSLITLLTKIETFNQETPKWKWNNRLEFLKKLFDIESKLNDLKGKNCLEKYFKNGKNETEIKNILLKNKRDINSEKTILSNQYQEKKTELFKKKQNINSEIKVYNEDKKIELLNQKNNLLAKHNDLFDKVVELMSKEFVGEKTCKFCGNELLPETLAIYRENFENAKMSQKKALENEMEVINQMMNNIDLQIANLEHLNLENEEAKLISYIENELSEIENRINELNKLEVENANEEEALKDYLVNSKAIIESINDNFENGLSFKLFNQKEDGTYASECVLMLDGKPYDYLSFGEKIYANLLITQYLQNSSDINFPLFIDNTNAFKIVNLQTQAILLLTKEDEDTLKNRGIKATDYYERKEK